MHENNVENASCKEFGASLQQANKKATNNFSDLAE